MAGGPGRNWVQPVRNLLILISLIVTGTLGGRGLYDWWIAPIVKYEPLPTYDLGERAATAVKVQNLGRSPAEEVFIHVDGIHATIIGCDRVRWDRDLQLVDGCTPDDDFVSYKESQLSPQSVASFLVITKTPVELADSQISVTFKGGSGRGVPAAQRPPWWRTLAPCTLWVFFGIFVGLGACWLCRKAKPYLTAR